MRIVQATEEEIRIFLRNLRVLSKFKTLVRWNLPYDDRLTLSSIITIKDEIKIWAEIASIRSRFANTGDYSRWVEHHGVWRVSVLDILYNRMGIDYDAPRSWSPTCSIIFRPLGWRHWYNKRGDGADLLKEERRKLNTLLHPSKYETWGDGAIQPFDFGFYDKKPKFEIPDDLIGVVENQK
jgi:hypothetical protein